MALADSPAVVSEDTPAGIHQYWCPEYKPARCCAVRLMPANWH